MTTQAPVFNSKQFEQRNFIPSYFTADQKTAVDLTASRVSENLNFISQMLGWAPSPNYWQTLRDTNNQGRQLLGGTYGVYHSFAVADVLFVENWAGNVVVTAIPNLAVGQKAVLGDYAYVLSSVINNGETQIVQFQGGLTDQLLTDLSTNLPLQVDVPQNRPSPFYRPEVEASGDTSFICGTSGTTLTLYPEWDTQKTTPFKVNIFLESATYYFNSPVYLSYSLTPSQDVSCFFLEDLGVWSLTIPKTLSSSQTSLTAYLVAPYGDSTAQTNAILQVGVASWQDPNDWGTEAVLKNFRGAWGNKGGALPFNLAFDSLGIHGFNEAKSVLLGQVQRSLSFDNLVQKVYQQKTFISPTEPDNAKPWDTWWNSSTGVYAVYYDFGGGSCSPWVQIQNSREIPDPVSITPAFIYSNVANWQIASPGLAEGVPILISDFTGLAVSDNVLGVQGTLTGPGFVFLQKTFDGYWQPLKFEYWNVADFAVDATKLPSNCPVFIYDSTGLLPVGSSYSVSNLPFSVQANLQVVLTKQHTNTQWTLSPDNPLRYVANTRLFAGAATPVEGELSWDWLDPDPWGRALAAYYGTAWVDVTTAGFTGPPLRNLDPNVVRVLCDGVLLTEGTSYQTSFYSISYTYNSATGNFDFVYNPFSFLGTVTLPKIVLTDALTAAFTSDITADVFSGLQYYFSPNAYDAETPLRLWKVDSLQSPGTLAHLAEKNYYNPLLADENLGPGSENWERFFVRLPPVYGRNSRLWDKANLVCQDFTYWGSSPAPELMECPPEDNLPLIYEEVYLFRQNLSDFQYIYSEPYLYSNLSYGYLSAIDDYSNSGIFPATDFAYDEWAEGFLETYEPLHHRQARTDLPTGAGYGDWRGAYTSITDCEEVTGFWVNDVESGVLDPISPPVWDASIFKFPPTCENNPESYTADANHYKVAYAYFTADLSASEDGFFDVQQEAAWRYPVKQPRTGYLLPRG